ncbi:MAG: hypothetical protein ABH851_06195 [Methanobacteriota archaeon]
MPVLKQRSIGCVEVNARNVYDDSKVVMLVPKEFSVVFGVDGFVINRMPGYQRTFESAVRRSEAALGYLIEVDHPQRDKILRGTSPEEAEGGLVCEIELFHGGVTRINRIPAHNDGSWYSKTKLPEGTRLESSVVQVSFGQKHVAEDEIGLLE